MKCIQCPNSACKVYDGSIVMIGRFPQTKWIVHKGYFMWEGKQECGWFFQSIPAGTIIPVTLEDLATVTIVSDPDGCVPDVPCDGPEDLYKNCPCPPGPHPHPGPPIPPIVKPRPIEVYMSGVNYIKGQIVYLEVDDFYQVKENFRSSFTEQSAAGNMAKDIEAGYLISMPRRSEIDHIDAEIHQIHEDIADLAELEGQDVARLDAKIDESVQNLNDRITEEVTEVNERIDSEVDTLDTRITSEVTTINERIDGEVQTLNDTINREAAAREQAVSTLEDKVDTEDANLQSQITALDTKVDTQVTRIDREISDLDEAKADKTALAAVDAKVDTLDTKVDAAVEGIEAEIDALDAAKADKTALASAVNTLTDSIDAVDTKVDAVDTKVDTQVSRLDTKIESGDATLQANIDALENQTASSFAGVESEIDALEINKADKTALNSAITSLNTTISVVDGKVDTAVARLDRDLAKAEDDIEDLQSDKANKTYVDHIASDLTDAINARLTIESARPLLKSVTYDPATATFTFLDMENHSFVFDLPLEATVKDGRYDAATKTLILVLVSGQEIQIPVGDLVDVYTGVDGAKIVVTINNQNQIGAAIKPGTIEKTDLTSALVTEIEAKADKTYVDDEIASVSGDVTDLDTKVDTAVERIDGEISTINTDKADKTYVDDEIASAKSYTDDEVAGLETTINSKLDTKMDLVTSAVTGNIAVFGANGQIVDSGIAPNQLRPAWTDIPAE